MTDTLCGLLSKALGWLVCVLMVALTGCAFTPSGEGGSTPLSPGPQGSATLQVLDTAHLGVSPLHLELTNARGQLVRDADVRFSETLTLDHLPAGSLHLSGSIRGYYGGGSHGETTLQLPQNGQIRLYVRGLGTYNETVHFEIIPDGIPQDVTCQQDDECGLRDSSLPSDDPCAGACPRVIDYSDPKWI